MEQPIIVLQCSKEEQVATLRFVLHALGYVWAGTKQSLIDHTPFSLKNTKGKNTNIVIFPHEKGVRYNFSEYWGLKDIDGVNYVIKVIE